MPPTFLQRNKKKSLLALLLLFLRERKILVLLLLVLLLASAVVLGPSSFLTGLPGGARFAAGVAWVAGKFGVDVSKWGLGPAGHDSSYAELLAAFRAAKAGNGAAGWGSFFGHGHGNGNGNGDGGAIPNSLDMVKASRSDLDGGKSGKGGADGLSNETVQGVIDPADARANKDAQGVALSDADLGGEREGLVKSAFAGGFMNGLLGGGSGSGGLSGLNGLGGGNGLVGSGGAGGFNAAGGAGAGALSGGAYATRGFFKGSGGASGTTSADLARIGLNGFTTGKAPSARVGGPAKGSLSSMRAHAVEATGMQGAASAGLGGNQAFFQLAEGRGRAVLAVTPNCAPPACPGEFQATNTGAIYDGNTVGPTNTSILNVPEVDGPNPPNIPDTSIATTYENQAQQMDADAKKCQEADKQYGPQSDALNAKMTSESDQFKAADCGGGGCSKSKRDHCRALGAQLQSTCNQFMQVNCARVHACPLTASQNCQSECSDNRDSDHRQRAQATTTDNGDGTEATSVAP
ncbi:MAG: hypothetical protein ACHQ51_11215 [Elusimicrobiota bacterium]